MAKNETISIPKKMFDNFYITKTNISVWLAIKDGNCKTYKEIAKYCQISLSTVKNNVHRLVELDFLYREKDNHGNGYTYTIPKHYKENSLL